MADVCTGGLRGKAAPTAGPVTRETGRPARAPRPPPASRAVPTCRAGSQVREPCRTGTTDDLPSPGQHRDENAVTRLRHPSWNCGGSTRASAPCRSCTTSTSPSTPARSPRWSATTAPASPPWSSASAASTPSTPASTSSRASRCTSHSPRDAAALGIEIVYQDLALCDNLDIVQNMFLGRERASRHRARRGDDGAPARRDPGRRCRCAPSSRCGSTSPASPAASARPSPSPRPCCGTRKVVILDEPTAALGVAQTAQVLDLVRRLADQGLGRRAHLAQHERRLRGRRPHRRALPRPDGRPGRRPSDITHTQIVELITAGRSGDLGLADAATSSDGMAPSQRPHPRSRSMTTTVTTDGPPPSRRHPPSAATCRNYWQRVRGGDIGSLPAPSACVVLCVVFSIAAARPS